MKKSILSIIIITFIVTNLQALIVLNDIVPAFSEGERNNIEAFVVEGSIHFLKGNSQAYLLLMEHEQLAKQAFTPVAALDYLEKSLTEFEAARGEYQKAFETAERAGYATDNIAKLKAFNYQAFASTRNLGAEEMNKVKSFFASGDILGAYNENLKNLDRIIVLLKKIQIELVKGNTPSLADSRLLLQQLTRAALFGNYCTLTATTIFQ